MKSKTIAALATAPFPSGLAVVRVSGPKAKETANLLFNGTKSPIDHPRELIFGWLNDPQTGQKLDQVLAVFMPTPHSFTGEDTVEFQMHGSPTLVDKVLKVIFASGVVPAQAGEFSRQAFLNGKLDLVQAEAVCELASATSENALKIARANLGGALSNAIDRIAEPLRNSLAEIEANLDFPEEEINPDSSEKIKASLNTVMEQTVKLRNSFEFGSRVRDGFRVLIAGKPNAGKSSLLNALLNRERAIVSDIPGTTRDFIEEELNIGGYRFIFCDSAGLRQSQDPIEKLGIELAIEKLDWADLVLLIADASEENPNWSEALSLIQARAKKIWFVVNKIDLNPAAIGVLICDSQTCTRNFYLSAKNQAGTDELLSALKDELKNSSSDYAEGNIVISNARHFECLNRGIESVQAAINGLNGNNPLELVSADLRVALNALEEIVGKTYTEDILGRIFSKFCIGK
jgi:tRNA modification GTPase